MDALTTIGSTFAVTAVLAWLARSLVVHFLNKDVERYKLQLQNESSVELERLKHQLQLAASEQEKRFSLLHERRAAAIAKLYSRLIKFLGAAEGFAALAEFHGEPSKREKAEMLGKRAEAFWFYFLEHRIYFSEDVCKKVETLFKTVTVSARSFSFWLGQKERDPEGRYHDKLDDAWDKAWKTMKDDVPPLQAAIETEFRALLGVVSSDK